jgi:peptidoglycan/xylan/chitin deacetylase (PgdA/CDA1 family)
MILFPPPVLPTFESIDRSIISIVEPFFSTQRSIDRFSHESSYATSKSQKPLIALTFDDGPYGQATVDILSILESEHVHATFFIVGKNAQKYPDIVKRIVADGDDIGNHSDDHSRTLPTESEADFTKNIQTAEAEIIKASGYKVHPTLFRPPYGAVSDKMLSTLGKNGFKTIFWDIDPRDWDAEHVSTPDIVHKVISEARPNAIILLHDGRDVQINYPRENTIHALKPIIETLKRGGYQLVTITELLAHQEAVGSVVHSLEAGRN